MSCVHSDHSEPEGAVALRDQVHFPLLSPGQRLALSLLGNLVHSAACEKAISPTDSLPSLSKPPTLASCEPKFHKLSGTLAPRPLKRYELYFHTASRIP